MTQNSASNDVRNSLVRQISQVGRVSEDDLRRVAHEVSSADIDFLSHYVGFNNGRWQSAVLVNPSGSEDDHILVDGVGSPTELAARMPNISAMVDSLVCHYGLKICWVRLARMLTGARVWEHRDFLELEQRDKVRLHVPILTNARSTLHFPGATVHLAAGYLWYLATDSPHGASNDGSDRIHLILDCEKGHSWNEETLDRRLDDSLVRYHPILDETALEGIESEFRRELDLGKVAEAEDRVLSLFGEWRLQGVTTYRLLANFYSAVGNDARSSHWLREEENKLYLR